MEPVPVLKHIYPKRKIVLMLKSHSEHGGA